MIFCCNSQMRRNSWRQAHGDWFSFYWSCQSNFPGEEAGFGHKDHGCAIETGIWLWSVVSRYKCLNFTVFFHWQSTPHPSPSCPGRPRQAIVRPAVKPPPIPAYAAEQKEKETKRPPQAPFPPAACPQQQTSQGHVQTLFKAAQDNRQGPSQVSPLLPGPPTLTSLDPKRQVRPDPPKRPPPPCPVNRQCAVNAFKTHFCLNIKTSF